MRFLSNAHSPFVLNRRRNTQVWHNWANKWLQDCYCRVRVIFWGQVAWKPMRVINSQHNWALISTQAGLLECTRMHQDAWEPYLVWILAPQFKAWDILQSYAANEHSRFARWPAHVTPRDALALIDRHLLWLPKGQKGYMVVDSARLGPPVLL